MIILRILEPSMKKGLVAGAAAGAMLLSGGPAQADAVDGTFTGRELAPESELHVPPITLCATFTPTPALPLEHQLALTVAGGVAPTGTAVFKNTSTKYDASPAGTFAEGSNCVGVPSGVPGTMTVTFGSNTCTASNATYKRTQSAYELTGNCGGTQYTFTGVQEPCPVIGGCPTDPDASALMQGTYGT